MMLDNFICLLKIFCTLRPKMRLILQFLKLVFESCFYFCNIFKMREKISGNPQTFFVFVLNCTKRRCSQIKPQLKVEIENGGKAPYKPSF